MSTETTAGNESPVTTHDSRTDPVESFVSVVTDALEQSGADQATIESVKTHGSAMADHVKQVESENKRLSELLDSTRREQAEIRSDVHEVRESIEETQEGSEEPDTPGSNPPPQAGSPAVPEAECSLGQAIRLPEHVAEENLTENQQRARSVVKDIHQYATSVPAGYRLSASELRRVLSAQEDGATIHGQTLARVRDFLVRLSGDHVELKESRGGTTSVIFDEDFVRRVVAWANESDGHGAVTHGGVSG